MVIIWAIVKCTQFGWFSVQFGQLNVLGISAPGISLGTLFLFIWMNFGCKIVQIWYCIPIVWSFIANHNNSSRISLLFVYIQLKWTDGCCELHSNSSKRWKLSFYTGKYTWRNHLLPYHLTPLFISNVEKLYSGHVSVWDLKFPTRWLNSLKPQNNLWENSYLVVTTMIIIIKHTFI